MNRYLNEATNVFPLSMVQAPALLCTFAIPKIKETYEKVYERGTIYSEKLL